MKNEVEQNFCGEDQSMVVCAFERDDRSVLGYTFFFFKDKYTIWKSFDLKQYIFFLSYDVSLYKVGK